MRSHSQLLRVAIALIIGLMILSACGGTATTKSQQAVHVPETTYVEPQPFSKGWTLYTLDNEHIALSLPPGWKEFNLSNGDLQGAINQVMDANPSFGGSLSGQINSMAAQGIKFYAFDQNSISIASGFAENLNLVRTERPGNLDLDGALKEAMDGLKNQLGLKLDGPVLSLRLTTTSGHALARLNYDAVFNMPGGTPITLSLVQYMAVTENDMYVLSGTAPISRFDDYDSIFEGVAQGMYFLP